MVGQFLGSSYFSCGLLQASRFGGGEVVFNYSVLVGPLSFTKLCSHSSLLVDYFFGILILNTNFVKFLPW